MQVVVFTSDVRGSGTDACVFIDIVGEAGSTGLQELKLFSNPEAAFERGSRDEFIVTGKDVGSVFSRIRIGHDNTGIDPAWHLDRVEVMGSDGEIPVNS